MQQAQLGNWLGVVLGVVVPMTLPTNTYVIAVGWLIAAVFAFQIVRNWLRSADTGQRFKRALRMIEPFHLQLVGNVGVIIFACIALTGLIWERYYWTPRTPPVKAAAELTAEPDGSMHATRARQWLRAEADKKALEKLKEVLATQRQRAEQNHQVVMERRYLPPNTPMAAPHEGYRNYDDAVAKILAAYKECFKKDAPDLTSDEYFRDRQAVSVHGERPDLSDREQRDVRRHFWMYQSFRSGMAEIDQVIDRESAQIQEVLDRLQRQVRNEPERSS